MREIKFRAWDTYSAKMHYKFTIGSVTNPNDNLWTCPTAWVEDRGWVNCDTFELMQYTGLKDKNDVEIYEGDIVKAHTYKRTNFKIEFIEGGFCATQNGIEYPIDINHFYPSIGCTIEVIGNIYENPELLEQIKCGS